MKFVPGGVQTIAQESITSRMLMQAGINNPDFLPTIMRLYQDDESPLTSILDIKGLKTKGLNFTTNNGSYRTVGSNHVQYAIANSDERKIYFRANADGKTYLDDKNGPTTPGLGYSFFYIWVDTNWAGFQEVIELADNRTLLYILTDPEEDTNETWRLKVKIYGAEDDTVFCDPFLLEENREAAAVMAPAEQDFSERGVEKYTFDGWGDAYLSLQRFKYSWSGTAKAMKVSGKWVIHNGQKLFLTEAEDQMMRRAARYLEYQIIFGKTTVNADTRKVTLRNEQGRDVLGGAGIMYSGDGPIDIPYNGWHKKFVETLLMNIDSYITRGGDGKREAVVVVGQQSSLSFHSMMRELGLTQNSNIVGDGASKGIIDSYAFYELDGIRLIPVRSSWFSQQRRPGLMMDDGTYSNEWDGMIMPIGFNQEGKPMVELVQLRPMTRGTVAGIDMGGNIASSVDGSQTHVLFQIGVISAIQPFRIYKPRYVKRSSFTGTPTPIGQ